ncbi:methylamine utilization protein [Alteromonas sp. ASW11-19]|uniref:Methylamine utilization protein n=1 Tax=Alteromonas salexigens TaxID=2982530 RepID=A0ABT2VML7_9ALTE|nr:methylamine utilization protein [Alteromonas salexigens]MCU7554319.1 methylamine utilization protein [Alteromonas salexigens]
MSPAISAKTLVIQDQLQNRLENAVVTWQADTAQAAPSEPAIMDQVGKQFLPEVLVVPQGTEVLFPNSDNIRHHVYSFSEAKTFEIKLYSGKPTEPVSFDTPGVVILGCNIHDQMIGYIYVSDGNGVGKTDDNGELTVPDNVEAVTVWHKNLDILQARRETISLSPGTTSETLILNLMATERPAPKTFGSRKFGG